MRRADAMGVRADRSQFVDAWRSRGSNSIFGWPFGKAGRPDRRAHDATATWDAGPLGHAQLVAAPDYSRILRSEAWLRRMLPLLIAALLVGIAMTRITVMQSAAEELDAQTRGELQLLTAVTSERLLDLAGLEDVTDDRGLALGLLRQAKPRFVEPAGRHYALLTGDGRILALHPESDATRPDGSFTPRGMVQLATALTGERTTRVAEFPDGTSVLAMARTVTTLPDGTSLRLLVFQDEASLYAGWHRKLLGEGLLLAAIAVVMFFILFAYFRQNQRSQESDGVYLETQGRFNTALSRGRCGLWDWDLARGRVFWSPSMYALLARSPGPDVVGLGDIAALVHPDDVDLIDVGNDALTGPHEMIDVRFRMRCGRGTWTWLRLRAELVTQEGQDPHLIGIASDISEQEAVERRSEEANRNVRAAVDTISEAFVIWDKHRRLVLCNGKFRQFYGLSESVSQPGARHEDVAAASQPQVSSREVESRLGERDSGARTREVLLEDGTWLQVAERRTADGNLVSVQTDITVLKRNEEMLLHSERKQAATIEDLREAKLESEIQAQENLDLASQCHEAQMRAEAGNRAKAKFLQNMSHELRTPLNAILGFSDLIKGGFLGPEAFDRYKQYAGHIHESGSFLLGMITDVLDMSKIEAGRRELQPEPMDLREVVDETLRMVAGQAEAKGVELRCMVPDIVEITADRLATTQVMVNLVNNAIKFTEAGGTVDVIVRRHGGTVRIAIVDTGCGIPHEALSKLGQPFEQVKTHDTRDHAGSGLGLAISRALARMHGGRLDIRSIVGRGTFVLVRLPEVAQIPDEADDGEPQVEVVAGGKAEAHRSMMPTAASRAPVLQHRRAA